MNAAVIIRRRGELTLPADLREKYRLKEGDTLRIVDLDGILVLTPMTPIVAELAREIERLRRAAGLSTEELLATLRAQRDQHLAKQHQVAGEGNL